MPAASLPLPEAGAVAGVNAPPAASRAVQPVVKAQSAAVQAPRAQAAKEVQAMSAQVGQALETVGQVSEAGAETAHGLGQDLQTILTQDGVEAAQDESLLPSVAGFGDFHNGRQLGRAAGQEIGASVSEYNSRFSVPAAQESEAPVSEPVQKDRGPVWPRFLAAGLALLPGVFLGWPLIAGGALYAGAAVAAASLTLSVLPFMGENTPKLLRSTPGAALFGLGALTTGLAVVSGLSLWAGPLVMLGGWGLVRYGRSESVHDRYDRAEALSAFFGGLGAAALAGLVLTSPAGWLALGLKVLSTAAASLLLMHLPSWVGHGVVSVFFSAYQGANGIHRVMSAVRHDTVLYDRLVRFTKGQLESSPWNAVWLAALWVPLWIAEGVKALLGLAVSLAVSAMQAPVLFLWGSAHELAAESSAAKFFAEWAHFMFDNVQNGKQALFNRAEALLLGHANSTSKLVSLPASLGINLLQLGWLAYALAGTPVLGLVGFVRAFSRMSAPYDSKRHDPERLRYNRDDRPGEKPQEPTDPDQPEKPSKPSLMPRLIASAMALLPAYFIGWPMLATLGPVFGGMFLATTLSLAALPFMPASTPKRIKELPGHLLTMQGVFMLIGQYLFFEVAPAAAAAALALPLSPALWMAALGIVGGWGLKRYLGKAAEKASGTSVDDPEYIGAFFAAAALAAGMGLTFLGTAGWLALGVKALAVLTSPLLLMHLPRWIWTGLRTVVEGPFVSAKGFYKLLNFWEKDTDFYRNMKRHASYWLDKTVWNGSWLSVLWVPTWAVQLTEFALAGALGLAMGVLRAPFNFAWGALAEYAPESAATRFFSAFVRTWTSYSEGKQSKAGFDGFARSFIRGMDAAHPVSHRPTFGAAFSMLGARIDQALWLLGTVLTLPLLLLYALYEGGKHALKGQTSDEDRSGHYY
ncbi:MAG TPA: hypothetical protein DCM05_06560 [Elusimicrobia bacterium]|nr:hypothetical protein [Elusimicrobiota bacterium]